MFYLMQIEGSHAIAQNAVHASVVAAPGASYTGAFHGAEWGLRTSSLRLDYLPSGFSAVLPPQTSFRSPVPGEVWGRKGGGVPQKQLTPTLSLPTHTIQLFT